MSPSHANKKGVRYRYYVSQALLQNRKAEAGSVARVSAPDVESLVCDSLRERLGAISSGHGADRDTRTSDDDPLGIDAAEEVSLVARVARITVKRQAIEIALNQGGDNQDQREGVFDNATSQYGDDPGEEIYLPIETSPTEVPRDDRIVVPWSAPASRARKGLLHEPKQQGLDPRDQQALLTAIAKARGWMADLIEGRVGSLEATAAREKIVVRHARFLAPLAFVSPRIVEVIVNGTAPAGLNASGLARGLPRTWREQEQRLGIA